ncbi:ATP-dependent DNA helicase RecQ-like [Ostrea edulis]|uniref:ATP-dependent DNA helicase RecQ-like n=1 Tax=Ostrea edulis TaxID=37623 RepID=UPI0024AF7415|nr:ATP-dependent DNA helicase RecQ-like [Ostrea edulis]
MVVADLTKELCLADPVIVSSNPDRPNIFIEVCRGLPNVNKMDKLDAALEPIARELRGKLLSFPVTVVYVNDLASLGYCYQYIEDELQDNAYHPKTEKIPENRIFGQFHMDYTLRMKAHIVDELRKSNRKIRLVFATVALGMGLNSPCISSVIHFRPPTTLEKYFQEIEPF